MQCNTWHTLGRSSWIDSRSLHLPVLWLSFSIYIWLTKTWNLSVWDVIDICSASWGPGLNFETICGIFFSQFFFADEFHLTYVSKIKWERHFPTRCELWWYFTSIKPGICDATKSAIASGESERLHFCIFQGDLEGAKGWSLQQGAVGFEGTWDPWERFNLQNCLEFFHSDETPWEYLLHESEKGKWMIVIYYCLQYIGWFHFFNIKAI